MKTVRIILLAFMVVGCVPTHHPNPELGKALIKEIKIEPYEDKDQQTSLYRVWFSYEIHGYHTIKNLYSCSLLFSGKDGKSFFGGRQGVQSCQIKGQTGRVEFVAHTPYDKDFSSSAETYEKIKYPLEYRIVIKQKISETHTLVIGDSDVMHEESMTN